MLLSYGRSVVLRRGCVHCRTAPGPLAHRGRVAPGHATGAALVQGAAPGTGAVPVLPAVPSYRTVTVVGRPRLTSAALPRFGNTRKFSVSCWPGVAGKVRTMLAVPAALSCDVP